ncbi:MAG: N4-gp56 family major capsid protein [Mesorhizobium sp.]|nr:MAG: N4-gp56 family major capsid protein [Mesorhizobium sp.]
MTTTGYSSPGISQRTNVYAEKEMLRWAKPIMVLEKLGLPKQMPKNKSDTIKFRRPRVFAAVNIPLVEGVTPSAVAFSYEDVQATLKQYGMVVEITDKIEDMHEDPVLNDATVQAGENIGRTIEALNYAIVRAGTSVFYTNGTQRTDVNTPVSLNKFRAAVRYLKAQKAMKITKVLSGSSDFATRPVEAAFVAVCHTDVESDIRNLAGFTPVAEYGQRSPISENEFGSVEEIRFVTSADLGPFTDGGGAKAGASGTMVSTSGTSADVYPIIIFGQDAWGHVALRGQGAVSPSIIPVGQKTKDDPLGQRGYVGWKTYHAGLILNQTWMTRIEAAATLLS